MLSSKIKDSKSEEFAYILRYVNGLKIHKKYDISRSNSQLQKSQFDEELDKEVDKFKKE